MICKTLHRKLKNMDLSRVQRKGKHFGSISDARPFTLVTSPLINHEWGKDRIVITTNGTYPWSFVIQIFRTGSPGPGCYRKTFEVTLTWQLESLGQVDSLWAAILYLGNYDRKLKIWNILSTERYTPLYGGAAIMLLHVNGKFTMGKFIGVGLDRNVWGGQV